MQPSTHPKTVDYKSCIYHLYLQYFQQQVLHLSAKRIAQVTVVKIPKMSRFAWLRAKRAKVDLGQASFPIFCERGRTLWFSVLVLYLLQQRHFYLIFWTLEYRIYFSTTFSLFFRPQYIGLEKIIGEIAEIKHCDFIWCSVASLI